MPLDSIKNKKVIPITMTGGININDSSVAINSDQVVDIKNIIVKKNTLVRSPGVENLTIKDTITDFFRGEYIHVEESGEERLYEVHGGKLYSVNKTNGAITEIYDMTGTGEAFFTEYNKKMFVCNGSAVIKVENNVGTLCGIAPPTTGSAAAAAGGTLPDGVYGIYIGYARKVSGVNVLYSTGRDLGNVTLGSGNNTVQITSFGNSSDPQVNNKVVWMTNAGGAIWYFYGETDDNTTTTINIAGTGSRDTTQDYLVEAADNNRPGNFEYMTIFNKQVFGSIGNTLYQSIKAQNDYDLEKYPGSYYKEYPFDIKGFFGLGEHLYINTDFGILRQPYGDISLEYEQVTFNIYFKYMNTVDDWNNVVIGLTNFGVRIFDGVKFTDSNLSRDITPDIEKMYSVDAIGNFKPFGIVYRRSMRTEYQLSYRDQSLGTLNNNKTYVLNLDRLFIQDAINFTAPWESLTHGYNYACVSNSNVLYMAQSYIGSSQIYKENVDHTYEIGMYDQDGTYQATAVNKTAYFETRVLIDSLFTQMYPEEVRLIVFLNTVASLILTVFEDVSILSDATIDKSSGATWDGETTLWDVSLWSNESPYFVKKPVKDGTSCYGCYFKFTQVANDHNFKIENLQLLLKTEQGRQT